MAHPNGSTARLGAASELAVAADLLRRGFLVYAAVQPNGTPDLIAYEPKTHKTIRVEVKTANPYVEGRQRGHYDVLAVVTRDGAMVTYQQGDLPLVEEGNINRCRAGHPISGGNEAGGAQSRSRCRTCANARKRERAREHRRTDPAWRERQNAWKRDHHYGPGHATGLRNGRTTTKLTEADVLAIRSAYAAGGTTYRMLGAQHGVDYTTIRAIVRRKTWCWLTEEVA
jgi:hypothetical protein